MAQLLNYDKLLDELITIKKDILHSIKDAMRHYDAYIVNFNNEERIGKPIEIFVLYNDDGTNFKDCIVTKIELLDDTLTATLLVPNDEDELIEYEVSENGQPFFFSNIDMLANIYEGVQKALEQ